MPFFHFPPLERQPQQQLEEEDLRAYTEQSHPFLLSKQLIKGDQTRWGKVRRCLKFLWKPQQQQEDEDLSPHTEDIHPHTKQKCPVFFKLMYDRHWEKVRECLQLPPSSSLEEDQSTRMSSFLSRAIEFPLSKTKRDLRKKSLLLCQQRDHSNLTCLALALGHNAPLDIIQGIIKIEPSLPCLFDDYGATAIHIACLNGASFKSIDFVLSKNECILKRLDIDKRSVLHHAVEYACNEVKNPSSNASSAGAKNSSFTPSSRTRSGVQPAPDSSNATSTKKPSLSMQYSKRTRTHTAATTAMEEEDQQSKSTSSPPYYQVLERLCEIAPEMIHVRDRKGLTPLDFVQIFKIKKIRKDDKEKYEQLQHIYEILRDASIKLYKKNKRQWERTGFKKDDSYFFDKVVLSSHHLK